MKWLKLFMLLSLIPFLSSCASVKNQSELIAHKLALHNFRYESDIRVYDRIDRPFYGDCEDFAFTLQRQIGGQVWFVVLNDASLAIRNHAVLVKNGIVYDNMYGRVVPKNEYPGHFRHTLDLETIKR